MNSPLLTLLMGLMTGAQPPVSTEHRVLVTQTDIYNLNRVYVETVDERAAYGVPMTLGYFASYADDVSSPEGGQAFASFDRVPKNSNHRVPSISAIATKVPDGHNYSIELKSLIDALEGLEVDVGGRIPEEKVTDGKKAPEKAEEKKAPVMVNLPIKMVAASDGKSTTAPTSFFITKKSLPVITATTRQSRQSEPQIQVHEVPVNSIARSYRVDVGPESYINGLLEKIKLGLAGDPAVGKEMFEKHFASVPLNFSIEVTSPHVDETGTRNIVKSWHFVHHISAGEHGGFLVVPSPSFDTLSAYQKYIDLQELKINNDGSVSFEFEAEPIISKIVLPSVPPGVRAAPADPSALSLSCVIPKTDKGREATACKRKKVGEAEKDMIVGSFTAPPPAPKPSDKPADEKASETANASETSAAKASDGQSVAFDLQDPKYPDVLYTVTISRKPAGTRSEGNGKPTIALKRFKK